MKKRVFAAALMAICLSILAYGSYAYTATDGIAHNVITTSGVDILLVEKQLTPDGELIDYPDVPVPVIPTASVSKIVSVQNLQSESYIRVQFDVVIADKEGNVFQQDASSSGVVKHINDAEKNVISLDMADSGWTQMGNWWYFNTPVKTGDSTTALFSQVNFDGPNMTNEYQNKTLTIQVTAQALQTANNMAEEPWSANGWPAES